MFEFAAKSLSDLRTSDHDAGRVAREVTFVVAVECANGTWCELDADDRTHGERLAINWVDNLNARGASVWPVEASGKLARRGVFFYYEDNR